MISDQIEKLIEQTKQHPNGLSRNKIVSHLEDAKAHANVLEREEFFDKGESPRPQGISLTCVCPSPGVIDKNCRALVHK